MHLLKKDCAHFCWPRDRSNLLSTKNGISAFWSLKAPWSEKTRKLNKYRARLSQVWCWSDQQRSKTVYKKKLNQQSRLLKRQALKFGCSLETRSKPPSTLATHAAYSTTTWLSMWSTLSTQLKSFRASKIYKRRSSSLLFLHKSKRQRKKKHLLLPVKL